MKLGVDYYPEHWPEERWATDARMMREAGLNIVRIGEFAWAKIEPAEGQYDWTWLDRAIQTLSAEGLQVVLCTPTATPPAWLVQKHPEILPVDAQGRRRNFGSRRHYCSNSPAYYEYTKRIVSALAERYSQHPAVIGWQTDNEFGCHDTARCYCPSCVKGFRRWLQKRYSSLELLNKAWGTIFWSQTYSDWEQINLPNLTVTEANPSHVLDFYRFSSDSVAAYQQYQIDILRRTAPKHFVTHNFMGNFSDLDMHNLVRPLDFASWDSYPTGYAEVAAAALYHPEEARPASLAYDAGDPYVTGFCHAITRGLKQAPFWVMEQQCGNINWSHTNTGVRPGIARLWTWHALGMGAEAVVYFRWRASLYAQEQYHSGLLRHDATPAAGYQDVQAMLPEREQMAAIAAEPDEPQVALLQDYNDLWALDLQPHRQDFTYQRHLFRYYRALAQLSVRADLVSPQADLGRYQLVIAPTAYLVDRALADKLTAYVQAGGTLLLGVRSGFKTPSNLVTSQPLPGALRDLIGARVVEWHALPPGADYTLEATIPGLTGAAEFWAEALEVDEPDVKVLARYTEYPFTNRAALIERPFGLGRVLYMGWYPSHKQARRLLEHIGRELGQEVLPQLPEGLVVCRRGRYTLLYNFTDQDLLANLGEQRVEVPARDVKVIERAE